MIKKQISLLLSTLLIIAFIFVAVTENANAQGGLPCTIEIEKVANPADNTPFDFVVTGDIDAMQTLSDPGNPIFVGGFNIDQTVTVTEELPSGWELQSIECIEGQTNCGSQVFEPCLSITINEETNSITATCEDDDTGRCTFTNALIPSQVPTLSEWGLVSIAGLLGIIGFIVIRKRHLVANK
jgi:hypothetical protein